MLKLMAIAMAAVVLAGGYSYAADSVPSVESDTVIAHCWGGGWGGGNRRMGWRNGGGRHGGYRGAGYNQGNYYYGG